MRRGVTVSIFDTLKPDRRVSLIALSSYTDQESGKYYRSSVYLLIKYMVGYRLKSLEFDFRILAFFSATLQVGVAKSFFWQFGEPGTSFAFGTVEK